MPVLEAGSTSLTLMWSSIDGGTYVVEATADLASWTPIATNAPVAQTNVPSPFTTRSLVETGAFLAGEISRFYRVRLTATNNYDTAGFAP
jgi:hypothetical protein